MKAKLAVLVILSLFSVGATAEPESWQVWTNTIDGRTQCAETSPGDGWEKNGRMFSFARCQYFQNRSAGFNGQANATSSRFVHASQADAERRSRMMGLFAIFVSARASK